MEEEKKNMPTVDDQYQRLIDARNFHYNNLNKWLMSFYAIIAALFVAFYTLYSKNVNIEVKIIVAVVGYVVSLSAWISGKGYGYWENMWIVKINQFEMDVLKFEKDMQVYTYIVDKDKHDHPYNPIKGANVSTTKVAIFMTAMISIAWGFLILMLMFDDIKCEIAKVLVAASISMGLSYFFMLVGTKLFPSLESEKNIQSH